MDTSPGTGFCALPAADAFCRHGDFFRFQIDRTGLLTCHTMDTGMLFPMDLHQTEPVEPSVDGAERAQILTERTKNLDREKQKENQYRKLPEEESPCLISEKLVASHERKCSEKGAGWAQVFAEGGNFGKSAEQEHGTNAYEQYEHGVFSIFQNMVEGKLLPLSEKGNPVEQVLQKAEGAEPAADKTPEQTSKEEEKSKHCKGNLESALI